MMEEWEREYKNHCEAKIFKSKEYKKFHKKVVDACAHIAGKKNRAFFNSCDYIEAFVNDEDPVEVAQTNCEDACR